MALLALLFSILIAAIGAIGLVSPATLFHFVRRFQSSAGLYAAAGFRVRSGLALLFTTDRSRAPERVGKQWKTRIILIIEFSCNNLKS